MLSKKHRLKGKRNFDKLYKEKSIKSSFFVVKKKKNNLGFFRTGIVVSSKVSKSAVLRNKIKRRVSSILEKLEKKQGIDIVIIVLPKAVEANFKEIKNDLFFIFKKAGLSEENSD